jgi:hypothetical protein
VNVGQRAVKGDTFRQPCSRSPAAVIKRAGKLIKLLVSVIT